MEDGASQESFACLMAPFLLADAFPLWLLASIGLLLTVAPMRGVEPLLVVRIVRELLVRREGNCYLVPLRCLPERDEGVHGSVERFALGFDGATHLIFMVRSGIEGVEPF